MKRRGFLKMLGLAPAAAAAVSLLGGKNKAVPVRAKPVPYTPETYTTGLVVTTCSATTHLTEWIVG